MDRGIFIGVIFLLHACFLKAQDGDRFESREEEMGGIHSPRPDDPVLEAIDNLMQCRYFESNEPETDPRVLNIFNFHKDSVPVYAHDEYRERLALLNSSTPFALTYNEKVKAYIDVYAVKKREVTSRALGLAAVYFPLFEEILDRYDMPLELKYLAVVESALNTRARSRSGAVGLWQFMYHTGKLYGLDVTSFYDERQDPYRATVAACKYLRDLHKMFGNWEMALAAYNCGPGTVTRAIRRSGGKREYWSLWPYLPRETRGYVPAFIAVNYIMNYAAEHNLYPTPAATSFFQYDTVHVNRMIMFSELSAALDIPISEIEYLNPMYKKNVIPYTGEPNILYLPGEKTGLFIRNENLAYTREEQDEKNDGGEAAFQEDVKEVKKIHIVREGEYLGVIADKYNCKVHDIKDWNGLRSTHIHPGQRLVVYVPSRFGEIRKSDSSPVYYIIQKGDTLWGIAKTSGISVDKIRELNNNIDDKSLKPGTKIVISTTG